MSESNRKLLWVDDDAETTLLALQWRFRKSGIAFDVATTYEIAERKLSEYRYSALLTDVVLPSGSIQLFSFLGLRLIENIRNGKYSNGLNGTKSDVNIAIFSVMNPVALKAIEGELPSLEVTFLEKPMSPDTLVEAVKDMLRMDI